MSHKLMTARFNGTKCNHCNKEISKGDAIVVNKTMPRKKRSFCSGICATNAEKASTASIPTPPKPKLQCKTKRDFLGVFA